MAIPAAKETPNQGSSPLYTVWYSVAAEQEDIVRKLPLFDSPSESSVSKEGALYYEGSYTGSGAIKGEPSPRGDSGGYYEAGVGVIMTGGPTMVKKDSRLIPYLGDTIHGVLIPDSLTVLLADWLGCDSYDRVFMSQLGSKGLFHWEGVHWAL